MDYHTSVEYWQGDTYRGWTARLDSCPETNKAGRTALGPFDHIRVPEDFGALLPDGFEWAGCGNCANAACDGNPLMMHGRCPHWQPRGAA
jgi:hypothetical protein